MGSASDERKMFDLQRARLAVAMLLSALTAKIILLFWLALNSRFVMDEFRQFGWSKYLGNGLYSSIWPGKAAGYAVFYEPSRWLGWNATSMLLAGRVQTVLLAYAIIAIIYVCARSLGESRPRSLFILLILLSFSNFIERIFRTISEPLALFFAAAALLTVLRGQQRRWTLIAAGMLSGLAFVTTQKSLYFNVALGLALVCDAALQQRYAEGVKRGIWLVLGWVGTFTVYCLVFGGAHPLPVARNLVFGPLGIVAPEIAAAYGGLRHYIVQTLVRNAVLYAFCFAGMLLALVRIRRLDERNRIALIFTTVVAALVFAHDQPWPYVFIMALPFMALWSLVLFDALATKRIYLLAASAVIGIAFATSFVANILYLRIDNREQFELVRRAEALVAPNERYFDGIGMLPNRYESSYQWLDQHNILVAKRQGKNSYPYRVFLNTPPKVIIWSYRMDDIEHVVDPLIRNSYVQIAPNIRIAGAGLHPGASKTFNVPIAGQYALYDVRGHSMPEQLEVNGRAESSPILLRKGAVTITSRGGSGEELLLPCGSYVGKIRPGGDNASLFAGVYD